MLLEVPHTPWGPHHSKSKPSLERHTFLIPASRLPECRQTKSLVGITDVEEESCSERVSRGQPQGPHVLGWLNAQYSSGELKPWSIMQMFLRHMEYLEMKTIITEIKNPVGR